MGRTSRVQIDLAEEKTRYHIKMKILKSNKNHRATKIVSLFFVVVLFTASIQISGCTIKQDKIGNTESDKKNSINNSFDVVLSWTGDPTETQTISWGGQEKYQGLVYFMEKSRYESSGQFDTSNTVKAEQTSIHNGKYYRYTAKIQNLKPGTEYFYTVGSSDENIRSNVGSFKTETEQDNDFEFMYMGDIQFELRDRDYPIWGELLKSAYSANPNLKFVLQGGDMVVNNAEIKEWSTFFQNGQSVFSKIPLMTVPGNHETSVIPEIYTKMMALSETDATDIPEEFYSFDYGDCHFIMLNSCIFMEERIKSYGEDSWNDLISKVNKWIENDLASSDSKWKIVVMHHPIYPIKEDSDLYERMRDMWEPIFIKNDVDLGLYGHQHVYMRTKEINGITYIMSRAGEKSSRYYEEGNKLPSFIQSFDEKSPSYQILNIWDNYIDIKSFDRSNSLVDSVKIIKD